MAHWARETCLPTIKQYNKIQENLISINDGIALILCNVNLLPTL